MHNWSTATLLFATWHWCDLWTLSDVSCAVDALPSFESSYALSVVSLTRLSSAADISRWCRDASVYLCSHLKCEVTQTYILRRQCSLCNRLINSELYLYSVKRGTSKQWITVWDTSVSYVDIRCYVAISRVELLVLNLNFRWLKWLYQWHYYSPSA